MARFPVLLVLPRCWGLMEGARFSPQISQIGGMVEDRKHNKSNDWYFPPDLAGALAPIVLSIVFIFALCGISWVSAEALFRLAICLGGVGVMLLFVARIPVYRQKRFFSLGPSAVSGIFRKVYCVAYIFIVPSILFLIFALLFLRR